MKTHLHLIPLMSALLSLVGIAGCARDTATPAGGQAPGGADGTVAVARLEPTQGNNARGTVRFSSESGGVRVTAEVTGLTPGDHGFHIHEQGDCSAPDATSAGGHFNPTNQPHAAPDAEARHIGDLGNLNADSNGRALLDYLDSKLTMAGPNSIIGRAVIVHAGRDDFKTQPTGDAGARVACGRIDPE